MTAEGPDTLWSELKLWTLMAVIWSTLGLAAFGLAVAVKYVKRGHYRAATATLKQRKLIVEPGWVYMVQPVSAWVKRNRVPKLVLEYRYVVGQTPYEGNLKLSDPHGFRPRWSGAHRPGDTFTVYYETAKPEVSVLWPVVSPQMVSGLLGFLTMMALWLAVVVLWTIATTLWRRRGLRRSGGD